MARRSTIIGKTLSVVLTLLIGLLVLQALAYGISFALNPEGGVGEFATKPTPGDELTVALVGLVGVGMIGFAALMILSVLLVWRRNPAGAYVAMILGGIYIAVGLCALRASWGWDAWFYGITGASLIVLSAAVRWLQTGERGEDPSS